MLDLTKQSASDTDVNETLTGLSLAAVELIRGADYADIMLIDDGNYRSVAATAPVMRELDAAQMRFGEGPCWQAAVADAVIRVTDFRTEERWSEFSKVAVATGVLSALSFQLYTHRHGTGALNVFSRAAGSFNVEDEAIGGMLATQAAIVLIASQKADADSILVVRDLIGQAKGVLMERFHIDAAHAFTLMVSYARNGSTTIQAVARDIVSST